LNKFAIFSTTAHLVAELLMMHCVIGSTLEPGAQSQKYTRLCVSRMEQGYCVITARVMALTALFSRAQHPGRGWVVKKRV